MTGCSPYPQSIFVKKLIQWISSTAGLVANARRIHLCTSSKR